MSISVLGYLHGWGELMFFDKSGQTMPALFVKKGWAWR